MSSSVCCWQQVYLHQQFRDHSDHHGSCGRDTIPYICGGILFAFFVVVVVVVFFAVERDPQINNSQNLQTVLSMKQVAVTIAIT